MLLPKFRIYPSLLDKFQRLVDVDKSFEGFANDDADGAYKRSIEEMTAEAEQALIDAINRVPYESEAADKGTAFNALVDYVATELPLPDGMTATLRQNEACAWYDVAFRGRTFQFYAGLVEKAANRFLDAVPQLRVSAILPTKYGLVDLYGVIDELVGGVVYDIKTTSRYEWGKYERGWQRYVYPYCLIAGDYVTDIWGFEFTAYQWVSRAGQPLDGTQYCEYYQHNQEDAKARLTGVCERFIEWLNAHRDQITDKKIFAED